MVRIGLEGAWLEVASHKSSAYARQGVGPYIAWTIAIDGKDAIVAYGKHEAKGMAVRMVEDMLEGKTDVLLEWSATRRLVVGAKFRPRQRRTNHRNEAVVYSTTDYRRLRD